jgi:hypothetical protein
MKAEYDDEMRPEYDWSKAVRGTYANRFTPAERDELRRRAGPDMVQELTAYTLRQVQELESALFTFFVLAAQQPVQKAARRAAELLDSGGGTCECNLVDPGLLARLQGIAAQRQWVQHSLHGSQQDPESVKPVLQRLETIYDEVRTTRRRVEELVQEHLAGAGMSTQEIERRTDETAKLWRAA